MMTPLSDRLLTVMPPLVRMPALTMMVLIVAWVFQPQRAVVNWLRQNAQHESKHRNGPQRQKHKHRKSSKDLKQPLIDSSDTPARGPSSSYSSGSSARDRSDPQRHNYQHPRFSEVSKVQSMHSLSTSTRDPPPPRTSTSLAYNWNGSGHEEYSHHTTSKVPNCRSMDSVGSSSSQATSRLYKPDPVDHSQKRREEQPKTSKPKRKTVSFVEEAKYKEFDLEEVPNYFKYGQVSYKSTKLDPPVDSRYYFW